MKTVVWEFRCSGWGVEHVYGLFLPDRLSRISPSELLLSPWSAKTNLEAIIDLVDHMEGCARLRNQVEIVCLHFFETYGLKVPVEESQSNLFFSPGSCRNSNLRFVIAVGAHRTSSSCVWSIAS